MLSWVSQGNLSLSLHNFKRFTQSTKITLSKNTKVHQDSWIPQESQQSTTRLPLADLESHQETPRNLRKTKHRWWFSLANQTSFSKSLTLRKMLQIINDHYTNSCTSVLFREIFVSIHTNFTLKHGNCCSSLSEKPNSIVHLLAYSTGWFIYSICWFQLT